MIALHDEFTVNLSIEETWRLLTDLPRIAVCMPGAKLDELVDGEYRGGISTKIGPITAKYRGAAIFREHDAVAHRVVIEATGREEKGSGSARALITAVLKPSETGTLVDVSTELLISGKAAQFGRSLMMEVSRSMVDAFVRNLELLITGGLGEGTAAAGSEPASPAVTEDQLDALKLVAVPLLRTARVPLAAAVGGLLLGVLLGRRDGRHRVGVC